MASNISLTLSRLRFVWSNSSLIFIYEVTPPSMSCSRSSATTIDVLFRFPPNNLLNCRFNPNTWTTCFKPCMVILMLTIFFLHLVVLTSIIRLLILLAIQKKKSGRESAELFWIRWLFSFAFPAFEPEMPRVDQTQATFWVIEQVDVLNCVFAVVDVLYRTIAKTSSNREKGSQVDV